MTTMEVKVVFKPLNNCLINLPSNLITPILNSTNLLVQQIVIAIIDEKNDELITYCGWTGFISGDLKAIEIDPHYARILNLTENKLIKVNLILDLNFPDFAQSVELEPVSTSDWELTELYAQSIEDKFLSQIRCISNNEKLVIRSNNNSNDTSGLIYFNVKNIKSLKGDLTVGRIGNDSELHIIPKPYGKSNKSLSNLNSNSNGHIEKKNQRSISSRRSGIGPIEYTGQIFRCAINKEGEGLCIYGKPVKSFKGIEFFQISVIEGPGTPKRARKVTNKELSMGLLAEDFGTSIVAKYVEISDDDDDQEYSQDGSTITLSPLLAISLGLEGTCGEKVLLKSCKRTIKLDPSNCEIVINKFITESKNETDDENNLLLKGTNNKKLQILEWRRKMSIILKETIIKIYGMSNLVPITNGLKLPIIEEILPHGGRLLIINNDNNNSNNNIGNNGNNKTKKSLLLNSWVLVNSENFQTEFKFKNEKLVPKSRVQETNSLKAIGNSKVIGQDKLIRKLISVLKNGISTLLYGKSGNGKTIICNKISEIFFDKGYYVKNINCEIDIEIENDDDDDSISKDEEKDKIKKSLKFFNKLIQSLNWHSPSLVILDNLDSIIPKQLENVDNGNSLQLTELIINKFENLIKQSAVTLLITSKTKDSINNLIFKKHLTEEEFNLKSPNKDQRFELLNYLIKTKFSGLYEYDFEKNILSDIVAETEGYLPIDLENLVDRSFHDLISNDDEKFELKHFLNGIKGYTPSSLRGAKLQKDMGTNWSDIGGLIEVKKLLLETLEWPTKYAPIFENCPLRLRSGILLYGYPGCGKTLLASAVASQCGLNFISIKGPEILNKYIGASEQSIRELFDRASSAKPCILFFDEFDSIAPKRGHDSTGVTDRIVNQLLTQMDGAEGLDGVYVLAATSRPDLIDSALLRPGRLDKSILCDLPDLENRLDILKTIVRSNKFNIDSDVDLREIAKLTEGYSGADLQAVVYNSYLKGVHESLDNQVKKGEEANNDNGNNKERKVEFFTLGYENKGKKKNDLQISKKIETIIDNEDLDLKEDRLDDDKSAFKKPVIFIRAKHLEEGLQDTKKSISNKELAKFNNIYSQLVDGKREGELPDGEGSKDVGVRATLM